MNILSHPQSLRLWLALTLTIVLNASAAARTSVPRQVAEVHNLENAAVRQYMSYGRYESFGERSYFAAHRDELTSALCLGQDQPEAVRVSWHALRPGSLYRLELTDETTGRRVHREELSDTACRLVNLVPGRTYIYKVRSGGKVVSKGRFGTSGQVRMLTVADSWNYRDLGGWRGLGGRPIRYEWIYRGGCLSGQWNPTVKETTETVGLGDNYTLSAVSARQLAEIGLKAELDLRGITNEGVWGNEDASHSRAIGETHVPSVAPKDYLHIMTDRGLHDPFAYYSVVQDVAYIIQKVVREHKPIAFHCRSGADRTGAVGMLLGALLGVHPGDIARDYELTTLSHEKVVMFGQKELQLRRADHSLTSPYGFFGRGFTTLTPPSYEETSLMQSQAYWYLNQYFAHEGVAISARDLDDFIMFMLSMTKEEYAPYRHSWAVNYPQKLQTVYQR